MPKSRDQTPESGDSIQSTGDSSSLGNKVAGKRMIDSAKKKILWLASKNEWGGLEQAMKTLEQTVAANKNSPELLSPLADIQDEVLKIHLHPNCLNPLKILFDDIVHWLHAADVRR